MKNIKNISITILIFLLISCTTQEKKWEEAKKENSIIRYKKFITEFPESKFVVEAKSNLELLEWGMAMSNKDINKLEEFITEFPDSKFRVEAKTNLELLEWEMAISNKDINKLNTCENKYARSKNLAKVKAMMLKHKWPPTKGDRVAIVKIWSKGTYTKYGIVVPSGIFRTSNGWKDFEGFNTEVEVFRDFSEEQSQGLGKMGLSTGVAYLLLDSAKRENIRPIDISKSDEQICLELGLPPVLFRSKETGK
jgi:hypothetical protein